jgi:GNAT superfamily N-acetyltransferase
MTKYIFRKATENDLSAIIALLADDVLGSTREAVTDPVADKYQKAFDAIDGDPNQFLLVVEDQSSVIGTLHLTFIPGLSRGGSWRSQIEAVRIASDRRGEGLGETMFSWAIDQSRKQGCHLVQLTSDVRRSEAHRFYERLGFVATHVGFKMEIASTD